MANNHMGSVEHGKLIVDELAKIAEKYDLNGEAWFYILYVKNAVQNLFLYFQI